MKVVELKPVPIYETVCSECKSKLQYKAAEVHWHNIICPVCGVLLWANTISPVAYDDTIGLKQLMQMHESQKEEKDD